MSSKLNYIPKITSYNDIRNEMNRDLEWRLSNRKETTPYGRPLYYNMNVQIIVTHECPFNCSFCMERQNPMSGKQDFAAQAAGDCFYYGNTYYMKLIVEYTLDNNCHCNSIDLKNGALTFFCSRTKVKPYKKCEVILHE